MSIIASLGLLLLVSVSAQAQCVSNTFICSDCTSLDACFGEVVYPIPCTAGQVCGNDGVNPTIDGCFDITDSSNTKASQCSCDASATAPSYMADGLSEDTAAYLACLPGSSAPESLVCTAPDVFLDGQVPPCGTAAPTTTPGPTAAPPTTPAPFACDDTGFVRDSSSCSKYWLCNDDSDANPTEANCDDGQSFNEATLACFDPCDPSAETFSCVGITGGVVDSVDCSVFHICVNGVVIGQPVPCADGEIFDGAACVAGTDCPSATDACLTCSTTPAPSTTAGATGASPTTPAADSSTAGSGSSTAGSDSSTSGSDSSTPGPDSSTSGSDSSTSGSDSSTSGSDSSTSGSDSSTSGSDSSTSGSDSSTSGSDSSTSGSDSSTSGSDSSTSDSGSSTSGSDSSTSDSVSSDDDDDESPSSSTTVSGSTTEGVTGVPDCTSASQEGYYEISGCFNVFYSCEDDDAGGFVLKEYTCPGSLVFDPTNNYCNLASLVPGC